MFVDGQDGRSEYQNIKIFKLTSPNLSSLVYVSNRPKPISDRDWRRIALKKILLKLFDSLNRKSLNEWNWRYFKETKTGENNSNCELYDINLPAQDQPNTECVSTEEPKLQNLVYDFPGILWSLISCL